MKPQKAKKLSRQLQKKGFLERLGSHKHFVLYVNGLKTAVRTKLSHGISEYGSELLTQMAKDIHLNTGEFEDLVECPMSVKEYVKLLRDRGVLKS